MNLNEKLNKKMWKVRSLFDLGVETVREMLIKEAKKFALDYDSSEWPGPEGWSNFIEDEIFPKNSTFYDNVNAAVFEHLFKEPLRLHHGPRIIRVGDLDKCRNFPSFSDDRRQSAFEEILDLLRIHPKMTCLDITSFSCQSFRAILNNSYHLICINQLVCNYVPVNHGGAILQRLSFPENLTHVEWTETCDDNCIDIISQFCPNLIVFNVKESNMVTNASYEYFPRLAELRHLNLVRTKMDFQHRAKLCYDIPSLVSMMDDNFARYLEWFKIMNRGPTRITYVSLGFRFDDCHHNNQVISSDTISYDLVANFFPKMVDFYTIYHLTFNGSIQPLIHLKKLALLFPYMDEFDNFISINPHVETIQISHPSFAQKLFLQMLRLKSFCICNPHSPLRLKNLKSLCMCNLYRYTHALSSWKGEFVDLENFTFVLTNHCKAECIRFIFQYFIPHFPNIRSLKIMDCSSDDNLHFHYPMATENEMMQCLQGMPFKMLEKVDISITAGKRCQSCIPLNGQTIYHIIKHFPNLKTIGEFKVGENISLQQLDNLSKFVATNDFDINLKIIF